MCGLNSAADSRGYGPIAGAIGGADVVVGPSFTLPDALGGAVPLLYMSAEKARWAVPLLAACASVEVRHLALDEAHMVLSWGTGFRTAYARLGALTLTLP